jgi:nucleotide-binding universal stress UspA family protein
VSAALSSVRGLPTEVPIGRVVVATDLSEASAGAVRLGSAIARAFGADLLIVHVLPDDDELPSVNDALGMKRGELLERRAGEAEGRLRRLESLLGHGQTSVHACVKCGAAAAEIVRLAKDAAADVIVLGSHGPAGRRGQCAEPVAERVRARARCPVVVALPSQGTQSAASQPDGPAIHGVLVATDLTGRSDAAVRWGRALGQRLGCPVHVLHVVGSARRRTRQTSAATRPDIVRAGDPVEQIVSCAKELGDDLVVLGAPRRGSLRAALVGGVGRGVVERAVLPTLTAR